MGKSSSLRLLHMTMKHQVMCDQERESPSSLLPNGDEDSTLVLSMAPKFEDIESLKANISYEAHDQNDSTNLLDGNRSDVECRNEEAISDLCSSAKLLDVDSDNQNLSHSKEDGEFSSVVSSEKVAANGCSLSIEESISRQSTDNILANEISNGADAHINSSSSYQDNSHDLPIDVSSSSSARFSRVLENISLPLLYIPTTKQLVANNEQLNISQAEKSKNEESLLSERDQREGDYVCNDEHENLQPLSDVLAVHEHHIQGTAISRTHSSTGSLSDYDKIHHVKSYSDIASPCDTYHLFPDNTSLSSLSTCTDFSVSAFSIGEENSESKCISHAEDAVFMDVNLHSRNSFDRTYNPLAIEDNQSLGKSNDSQNAAPKKKTSGFKNIFGKKVKDDGTPGWKFFGKIPPKVAESKASEEIKSEIEARRQKAMKEKPQANFQPNRKAASEVLSTTALILENRPQNLPTKNPEEEERHKQQYNLMIEAAKKKEQKDLKQKKKRLQQQRKLEDKLMSFAQTWMTNILPNWESMKQTKKVRELWWLGLPSNIRGQVWTLAIGNDLNITHELYEICNKRAEDKVKVAIQSQSGHKNHVVEQEPTLPHDLEDSVNVIKLDVSRTFPHLGIFQKGGPYHDLLHSLLGAYACYRPDVGYVQGMSFIAAILLLNMEVADAFVCFANLLNRPCQLAFFRMDENVMAAYYDTFDAFFKENLPKLQAHVAHNKVTPNLYLMEWVFLLYSKSLPLDVACRVWDLFCRDGEEFLFRAAIGILKLYENTLLKMDFFHMAQFLTKLPEDISSEELFSELEGVRMSIDKRGFNSVYAFYKDVHDSSS